MLKNNAIRLGGGMIALLLMFFSVFGMSHMAYIVLTIATLILLAISIKKETANNWDQFIEGSLFTIEWMAEPIQNPPLRSFSPNAEKILGYKPKETLSADFSIHALIHPEDAGRFMNKLKHSIENNTNAFEASYRLKIKSGDYLWVYAFTTMLRNKEGKLIAIRSYMYDQSLQKNTEEALRIAEEALEKTAYDLTENIPVGTYTMVQAPTGGMAKFAFMSSRFLEMTGLTREEAAADPLKAFACVHPDDFEYWVSINAKTFEEKTEFYGETRVIVNGEVRWVSAESKPRTLSDGTTVWEGVLIDITESKLYKKQIIEEKEKAEAANIAKSQFLANMSHEIRTPLNGVIGFTDLLKNTNLSPLQKQYVDNANVSGHALLGIVNDILDFSKIESGMMELENIKANVRELMKNCVDIIKYSADKKDLKILTDIDPIVPTIALLDPLRLMQIITNLLSNAVKFTEKGEVELKVRYTPIDKGQGVLTFLVRDTGIGITQAQKAKMFKAFSQADTSTTRKFGGTGLGLAISAMIAEKMGSKINVNSSPGKGSIFFFDLKCDVENEASNTEQTLQEQKQLTEKLNLRANTKILVAEDVEMNMFLIESVLQELIPDAAIMKAYTGQQAFELYQKQHPDLILMDVQMPELDGLNATRKIREIEAVSGRNTPIVALTAGALAEERKRCFDAGMNDFLTKPINKGKINGVLFKFLSIKKKTDPEALSDFHETNHFNHRKLSETFAGKGIIIEKILLMALKDIPVKIERLHKALAEKDALELKVSAHSLKGIALNVHLQLLVKIAEEIEIMARENRMTHIPARLSDLNHEWNIVETILNQYLCRPVKQDHG